ncbi:hypothetical protein PROFUN_09326 [Planoprotostelium fungivorum]|uniref:Uncharacterized protein n=1 Tax=Planoprotostelium fungivorum TaxID=1890364 RepID=A0A2P6NHB0_9EUKA|nr:hypothetical protein PROFUN_09326 [Planoprotostelium fungivorum]
MRPTQLYLYLSEAHAFTKKGRSCRDGQSHPYSHPYWSLFSQMKLSCRDRGIYSQLQTLTSRFTQGRIWEGSKRLSFSVQQNARNREEERSMPSKLTEREPASSPPLAGSLHGIQKRTHLGMLQMQCRELELITAHKSSNSGLERSQCKRCGQQKGTSKAAVCDSCRWLLQHKLYKMEQFRMATLETSATESSD